MIENCLYCGGRNAAHQKSCIVVNQENKAQYFLAYTQVVQDNNLELASTNRGYLQGWCNGLRELAKLARKNRRNK